MRLALSSPSPPCFKRVFSFSRYEGLCACCTDRTSGDGCARVQLGKIMNEVDCGWQRSSLKRNGSQQRDGILTRPSPPPPPPPPPSLPSLYTQQSTQTVDQCTHESDGANTHFALAHTRRLPEAAPACSSSFCLRVWTCCFCLKVNGRFLLP